MLIKFLITMLLGSFAQFAVAETAQPEDVPQ